MKTETPAPVEASFASFGLSEPILAGVTAAGYKAPTPIQAAAIPVVLSGKDLIAQARTGTGKTAAFGLPAMSRLKFDGSVEILVLTPTRELAGQVSDELFRLGRIAKVRSVAVYGGQSSSRQIELIRRGCQIVVATPGRLLDHLESKRMGKFAPSTIILDEADEMLDMGFMDDLKAIFKHLPAQTAEGEAEGGEGKRRQTLMFSATMPPPIRKLAQEILKQPVTINLTQQEATNTDVEQSFYVIEEGERLDAVVRIIDAEEPAKSILFCRTKRETDELCEVLIARGCQARALHGDIEQGQRQEIIRAFKDGRLEMLVATDVAARGLDVTGVTHVINFHMPFDQAGYVHRIGRTARAGQKGKAITLVNPFEFRALKRLQSAIKASFIHREVPSAADIHAKEDAKLIRKVCLQEVSDEAVEMLSNLEEQLDPTQIACKLITMILAKRKVRGPEAIGVRGPRLKTLLSGGGAGAGGGGGGYRGGGGGHGDRRDRFRGKGFKDRRPR
ncbi:MAG TPA: DEAD/DEAH box helicase [Tepidisphaeraceae bacterium]|nr:DEAD/DEAH box helicase [Tepidisphaeraceae bacterium]